MLTLKKKEIKSDIFFSQVFPAICSNSPIMNAISKYKYLVILRIIQTLKKYKLNLSISQYTLGIRKSIPYTLIRRNTDPRINVTFKLVTLPMFI